MTSIIANSTVALNFGKQLEKEIEGEVLFDNFSRGQYATDASIYQMIPTGVVVPKNSSDIEKVINLNFNQLKDKAISESKTDESTYQIVFIESLRSSGLLANACYYLDLFIETNNNPKLISYKDHYTK